MPWPSCTMQRIRYRAREMRYRIGDFSLPGTWPLGNSSHYPLFKSSRRSLRYRPWRTWAELGSWNKGTKAVTEILQGDGTQYSCSPSRSITITNRTKNFDYSSCLVDSCSENTCRFAWGYRVLLPGHETGLCGSGLSFDRHIYWYSVDSGRVQVQIMINIDGREEAICSTEYMKPILNQ